jgi:Coenzyme PQQ synthesis protein D (PqqD).
MSYSIKSDISSKEIGGELFIYNRKNSTICSFNGAGVFIWDLLNKKTPFDEISRRLCEEYDVLPKEAALDVTDFVKNLGDNGLIAFLPE